ncbi:sulfoxide reductase heme-binding subunit YedZ [Thiohalomonas denitrificans]|uniref:Protein-methionine-sulfoxide reductase heme-binding subunit MsrQ n=2 Tax=Thiohalomonas denitrificans TaxID=415747 RepID=A0A1G5Q6B8_9GAMM|nr:sulfoxide reductase heme-binding subunit YedZ [Thiohalomonas denitrificans]
MRARAAGSTVRKDPIPRIKALVFPAALLPALYLWFATLTGNLGANPIEALIRGHGDWALRFLLLTLAITPLRRLSRWGGIMRFRRMLGLFAFFYATIHLLGYLVLDQFFAWGAIVEDIIERPFITVGMAACVLLVPLAITSTRKMQRRLGGRRWLRLHRLVYPAAALAVLHFYLMVKADTREPLIYAFLLAILLLMRLPPVAWAITRKP